MWLLQRCLVRVVAKRNDLRARFEDRNLAVRGRVLATEEQPRVSGDQGPRNDSPNLACQVNQVVRSDDHT